MLSVSWHTFSGTIGFSIGCEDLVDDPQSARLALFLAGM